jgi:hypothetical protein
MSRFALCVQNVHVKLRGQRHWYFDRREALQHEENGQQNKERTKSSGKRGKIQTRKGRKAGKGNSDPKEEASSKNDSVGTLPGEMILRWHKPCLLE